MGSDRPSNPCYCVVQVCFCVFVLLGCGFVAVRQQALEQRLQVLEEQQLMLEQLVRPATRKAEVPKRVRRDATDCVCPADLLSTAYCTFPSTFQLNSGKSSSNMALMLIDFSRAISPGEIDENSAEQRMRDLKFFLEKISRRTIANYFLLLAREIKA
ncbi:unnamed protein product [Colias eurytheme]|nr:unnamed protein product [Colias eurytheme]